MAHPEFEHFEYDASVRAWFGHLPLARFAEFALRDDSGEEPDDPRAVLEQAEAALRQMRERLADQAGPAAQRLFDAFDAEAARLQAETESADEDDEDTDDERDAEARLEQQRLRDGLFPVQIRSPDGEPPTPEQEASFRTLIDQQEQVRSDVLAALFDSYQEYFRDERWRQICGMPEIDSPEGLTAASQLRGVSIARDAKGGFARMIFDVDCDWEVEHGMYVVYHPAEGATWTTADGLMEMFDPEEFEPGEGGETPGWYPVWQALVSGDEEQARELVAEGCDLNDVEDSDLPPPLCMAVGSADERMVRLLLDFGADPSLADAEGRTPLDIARESLGDLSTEQDDELSAAMAEFMESVAGEMMAEHRQKLEAIVRILEGAR